MNRKRKWLLCSLALLCGLAFSLTTFSDSQEAAQKMPRFLKQLSDFYRDMGVQKLSQVSSNQKKLAPQNMVRMLWNDDLTGKKGTSTQKIRKATIDILIDTELQKRWGNPAFDVSRGTIRATSNPKALESLYLKIRKAWQKNNTWHAFCEFALFKAEEIAAHTTITRFNLAPTPELNNDLGSESTGATRLRVGSAGDWDPDKGYTGKGVIVGDVDSGIDWTHGDFVNPDGTTRILYLWDTSVDTAGKDPETLFGIMGFDYGTVYTKAEIDGGGCPEIDTNGHGTHTIGTAAGNGGETGKYTGMAPNADIIFVKGLDMWGIEFIFEMATRLGKPAVVNNSYGYPWIPVYLWAGTAQYIVWAPGDGSCEESQYIDWLNTMYPKGSIVVKSAGNDGMWPDSYIEHPELFDYSYALYDGSQHIGGKSGNGTALKYTYNRIPHPEKFGIRSEYSNFWIRSRKPVKVTINTGVKTYTFKTGEYGDFSDEYASANDYDMDLRDSYNNEYCGYFLFNDYNADPGWGEGNWTINVKALHAGDVAKWDIWLYSQRLYWGDAGHSFYNNFWDSCFAGRSNMTEYMLDWSAAKNIITVGSWTTRSEYDALDGYTYYPWGFFEPKLDDITYFSSPGPSRDGRMKPDIAAPGAVIMSAASKDAGWADYDLDPDGKHGWMWGTSMAAPHATGGIALMLQKFPRKSVGEIRSLLKRWAIKDSFTRAVGPTGFGAGKLNVLPLKTKPVAMITVDRKVLDLSNGDVANLSGAGSYDPDKLPFTYNWTVVSKPAGAVYSFFTNKSRAILVPDPTKVGYYKVRLVAVGDVLSSNAATITIKTVK